MTQAQVGLPLVIQQLYGGVPFTPGADTMAGGFRTSPGFRPGSPVSMTAPSTPGFTDVMPQVPGVPFGAQTTLADLVAFNPAASQYALAGFTVGEILAMPEFADFKPQQATTGGTATSAGLAALEAQLRDTGRSPEDRGTFAERFGTAEDQGFGFDAAGGTGTFQNPALGTYGDLFTPAPGLGKAFNQFGVERDIGIMNDLGLNLANTVGPIAVAKPGIPGVIEKMGAAFKKSQQEKEAAAKAAKIAEQQAAAKKLQQEIKAIFDKREQDKKAKEKAEQAKKAKEIKEQQAAAKKLSEQIKNQFKKYQGGGGGGSGGGGGGSGGGTGGGGGGCFVEGTMIQMADGTEKEITTIKVGEETRGGTVQAKMEFEPQVIYNYMGVEVSGSHWVIEDNQFVAVEDSKRGVKTDKVEPVHTFKTSNNRMWIKDIEFGDFETGSDEDWEPHFEMVRQKLNKQLNGNI